MAAALLMVVSFAGLAAGAESDEHEARRADQISAQLMSPFCPGKTLDACTSSSAAAWRTDIRKWTAEGVSSAAIKERLEARAGHSLSALPDEGQALWLPALTAALAIGLLLALGRFVLRTRAAGQSNTPELAAAAEGDLEMDARLDRELALLDER